MNLDIAPQIAIITSFFPEHLDYHGSLANYKAAKSQIAQKQTEEDTIFYNSESEGATRIAKQSPGEAIPYSTDDAIVQLDETKLIGQHNLSNIAGACAVAKHLSIPEDIIKRAIQAFEGLPHRLQSLGIHHGIEWVNDSISTTPESAIAALDALDQKVDTIILGGQNRGFNYKNLAERLARSTVSHAILLPDSGQVIEKELKNTDFSGQIHQASTIDKAVAIAKKLTESDTICLLSPASPSYNQFSNFEERGKAFAEAISEE